MTMQADPSANSSAASETTVDRAEIEKFSKLSQEWWDPTGKMAPLHKINPLRLAFIRDAACRKFDRNARSLTCLEGLRVLDIGCGGGLLTEPLTRLGAKVTGIDAGAKNIAVAKLHAERMELDIDYRETTSEALAAEGARFDIVLNMEVVEHVDNVPLYMKSCADLVKPGGLMLTATLNRTLRARALAVFAAERVLRWLPRGTHDWNKFLTPDEIKALITRNGLRVTDQTGVVFHPLAEEWRRSHDMAINYMVMAARPA